MGCKRCTGRTESLKTQDNQRESGGMKSRPTHVRVDRSVLLPSTEVIHGVNSIIAFLLCLKRYSASGHLREGGPSRDIKARDRTRKR